MEGMLSSWGIVQAQVQAAVIQGLLSLIGIVVTGVFAVLSWRRTQSAERDRQIALRAEKVADYCAALRAEIASELANLTAFDLEAHFADIESRYADDKSYSVTVPRLARNLVFSSITGELHILPHSVVSAVIDYERFRETTASFVDDMKDDRFSRMSTSRQLEMYRGYLAMRAKLALLARAASKALDEVEDAQ